MEIYKDIPGYEGIYQVSDFGNVKSLDRISANGRKLVGKKLKAATNTRGYKHACLCRYGKQKVFTVHILVAKAFLGYKPEVKEFVCDHIDNDKSNNRLSNLQLITQRENASKNSKNKSITKSKYTGVTWVKDRNKWLACIRIQGKTVNLGRYDKERDAMLAYETRLMELKQE